jgi:tetratricopeptide (TPR) repeat protein
VIPVLLLLAVLAAGSPGDAVTEADARLAAGDPAAALGILDTALAAEPAPEASLRARLQEARGRCLRAAGRPWDAEAAFAAALDAAPGDADAALGRGGVYLDLAREAAAAERPVGAEIRALAADARRWFEAAGKARPGDLRAVEGLARARLLDLDFAGAAAAARALLEARPGDAGGHHLLAEALRAGGDRAAAAAAEGAALAARPDFEEAAARRVGDLAAAEGPAAARAAAAAFLAGRAPSDGVLRALWAVEAPARRFDPFEEVVLGALAKRPDDPLLLHWLGHVRLSAGRRDGALEVFRRKAALEPRNPGPRLQVGRLLAAKGDAAGAEEAFEAALAAGLAPGDPVFPVLVEGLSAAGALHGQARRYADAERVFRRLAALEPGEPSWPTFVGLSLRRLGRIPEAEAAFSAAVELSPFGGVALNERGLLRLGAGRLDEAKTDFEASAAADPRATAALENLGNLARDAGRPAEAAVHFREAHRRAAAFRDEDDRRKFRRYLDVVLHDPGGR